MLKAHLDVDGFRVCKDRVIAYMRRVEEMLKIKMIIHQLEMLLVHE